MNWSSTFYTLYLTIFFSLWIMSMNKYTKKGSQKTILFCILRYINFFKSFLLIYIPTNIIITCIQSLLFQLSRDCQTFICQIVFAHFKVKLIIPQFAFHQLLIILKNVQIIIHLYLLLQKLHVSILLITISQFFFFGN